MTGWTTGSLNPGGQLDKLLISIGILALAALACQAKIVFDGYGPLKSRP